MQPIISGSPAYKICIDHHEDNNLDAELKITSESASATAVLIYDLLINLKAAIDQETAMALYVGILTDTNSFSEPNTTSRAHEVASELMQYGIRSEEIYRKIFHINSWNRTELFKDTLATLSSSCGGKLAWMKITREMVEKSGALREEIEGFVDYPLTIDGVQIAILFLEIPGTGTKISLRAINSLNVHELTQRFGGGGHRHAAGIRLYEVSIDKAITQVLDEACRYFNSQKSQ